MALPDVPLTGLRVVQQAAVLGSFSAVAEALGYTQSAISRQIAVVEAAVGAPLFERRARGVRPTEAGTVLAEHATSVFDALEAAQVAIGRIRDRLEGRLVLASIPVAMTVLVPRAIAHLARINPALDISLHEGSTPTVIQRLRDGLVDIGVIATGEELPQYDLEDLRRDVLSVAGLRVAVPVGHRLAGRDHVSVDELHDEAWIVGLPVVENEPVFGAWPTLRDAHVAHASREWPTRLGMVAAGLGIAVIPSIGAASVPAGVVVIEVDDPAHKKRSAVALTPMIATDAARAMVTALRSEAAQIALSGSTASSRRARDREDVLRPPEPASPSSAVRERR